MAARQPSPPAPQRQAADAVKAIAAMTLPELAAFVCSHLGQQGIPVVLVGGSCVSIYSDNRYQTADLDFG